MAIGDLSDSPSYSQLLEAMRAGQVEQLVLLPNQDLVQVQFKDGKTSKVNIFPNDQEGCAPLRPTTCPSMCVIARGKPP